MRGAGEEPLHLSPRSRIPSSPPSTVTAFIEQAGRFFQRRFGVPSHAQSLRRSERISGFGHYNFSTRSIIIRTDLADELERFLARTASPAELDPPLLKAAIYTCIHEVIHSLGPASETEMAQIEHTRVDAPIHALAEGTAEVIAEDYLFPLLSALGLGRRRPSLRAIGRKWPCYTAQSTLVREMVIWIAKRARVSPETVLRDIVSQSCTSRSILQLSARMTGAVATPRRPSAAATQRLGIALQQELLTSLRTTHMIWLRWGGSNMAARAGGQEAELLLLALENLLPHLPSGFREEGQSARTG